jgi:hypothetical protein
MTCDVAMIAAMMAPAIVAVAVLLEQIQGVATYLVTLSGLRITTLNNKQLRTL